MSIAKNLKIELPAEVRFVIGELRKAGYEAYAVGGCVRDSLIGRIPGDWDITTSALPQEVKSVFKRTVDTGIEHGTVTVMVKSEVGLTGYEVTTYRVDGEYEDMRHPKQVAFTRSLEEDLKRRDFTINAMAYNDETGIVDLYGGCGDLDRHMIRCVGKADDRFDEDALRILRAVRFAAQLDFSIEEETAASIKSHAPNLRAVSKERIYVELNKLICSAHMEKCRLLAAYDLAPYITGSFSEAALENPGKMKAQWTVPEGILHAPDKVRALDLSSTVSVEYRYLRYALLFAGMERAAVETILKDLKSDTFTMKSAGILAGEVLSVLPPDRVGLKAYISGMDQSLFEDLLMVKFALKNTEIFFQKCPKENVDSILKTYEDIIGRAEPIYLKSLAVTGNDLIAAGIPKGPSLGLVLKHMLAEVWAEPTHNTPEYLLSPAFLSAFL